ACTDASRRCAVAYRLDCRRPTASAGAPETPLTYTRLVRFLTRPSLLFVFLVSTLTAAAGLPTPESVFGFLPGADYKLATYDQSVDYFRKLAATTRHMRIVEAGKTTQGRPMYFALVSSPDNLARIDRYREIARRLAHPEGLSETEARRLARE